MNLPSNSLTADEAAEIQTIANKYRTTIDVVGSRAAGQGRNVQTMLPMKEYVPPGTPYRSDIDFRVDAAHPRLDDLVAELRKVGHDAGTAGRKWSNNPATPGGRETQPPFLRFVPE